MARIRTYGLDSNIDPADKVVGTDGTPGPNQGSTKNFTVAALAAYIDATLDPISGGGTINTIPIWTGAEELGDSIITYSPGNTAITVGGKLDVTSTLNVAANTTTASLTLQGYLADVNGEYGTAGQLLSSTGTAVDWIDAPVTGVVGSGTVNTLAMFTPDGVSIGDSIVAVTGGGTKITVTGGASITGNVGISGNLDVTLVATFESDVSLGEGLKDASDSYGTAGQILTSTATQTSWQDFSALVPNNITGSGTVEYIPKFTPDGTAIGNSIMFTKSNGTELQVGVSGVTQTTLGAGFMSTGGFGADTVTATNINAGSSGTLTASGNIILGDATADTTTINSTLSILSVVKDSTDTVGTLKQVLVANAASELLWEDQVDTSYSISSQQAAADVEITLLGSDTTETEVTLVAGNSITLTDDGSNSVTIAATGGAANTTYTLESTQLASQTSLRLVGTDAVNSNYIFTAGTGVSFTQGTDETTINVAADNVTGAGTLNKLPLWTPDGQTLGDSVVFQDSNQGVIISRPAAGSSIDELTVKGISSSIVIESTTAGDSFLTFKPNVTSSGLGVFSIVDPTPPSAGTPLAKFVWKKGATEYMRLDTSNGRVGIGTTTPASKLDVDGDYISMNGIPFVKQFSGTNTIYLGDVASNGQTVELVSDTDRLVVLSGSILELGNSGVNTQITTLAPIWIKDGLKDGSNSLGTAGQILSSNGTEVNWIDVGSIGVDGSGTVGTLAVWGPDTTTLEDSAISQGAGVVKIGSQATPVIVNTYGNTNLGITSATAVTTIAGATTAINTPATTVGLTSGDLLTVESQTIVKGDATFNAHANFDSNAFFQGSIDDSTNSSGTANQILTSTGTQVMWKDIEAVMPFTYGTGTWTPVLKTYLTTTKNIPANLVYKPGSVVGTYTKIGDKVLCEFKLFYKFINEATWPANEFLIIDGLPFLPEGSTKDSNLSGELSRLSSYKSTAQDEMPYLLTNAASTFFDCVYPTGLGILPPANVDAGTKPLLASNFSDQDDYTGGNWVEFYGSFTYTTI
tara:strand:+ start:625 stop:3720 length:3096 start_codon:yes stop_codon:yes gene_type:complete